ncbi:polysaccharide pyruvyl transferase family protein [Streptomyces sp. cmx-18-6]|uniref:polysaccharide pyruvyl transferase family protein n=1 Tax=Streptomyces sp. cmx-18-6 TaxID=2790930 RepID=UPI0039814A44
MVLQQRAWSGNFGNFVFSDSVHKMLLTEDRDISIISEKDVHREAASTLAARVNDEYDILVLPFANAFRTAYLPHLKKWTQLIRELRIPVMVIGIGAQSTLEYELEPLAPLNDAVRDFCRAVLERSPSMGVRGHFTHAYLTSLGIKDVDVIGCPSMFRNGDRFSVREKSGTLGADALIAASFTETGAGDASAILRSNLQRYRNLHYIAQDLPDLEMMYWGDTSEAAQLEADQPRHRTHPVFQDNRARLFLDPVTWINTLGTYDFSFGTRIHGNITALLGGTPSVVLAHDSRTRELSEYFDIPHRRLTDFAGRIDVAELYDGADFSALLSGHRRRFEVITGFLAKHGLDHVYAEGGDQGAAFERRMSEIEFAPPVESWQGDTDPTGFRTAWLHSNTMRQKRQLATARKSIVGLTSQVAELEKTVASLDKALRALQQEREGGRKPASESPHRRARRAVGKRIRRLSE